MPFYIAEYLADTQHLNSEENSAYLLLLFAMWRQGGQLENDARKLARIARINPRRWHLVAPEVMAFFDDDGSFITQRRLLREYEKAMSKSEKRSASGMAGARAKALKRKEMDQANGERSLKHSLDTRYKILEREKETRAEASEAFEAWWGAYPNRVGKDAAKRAYASALQSGADPDEMLRAVERYRLGKPSGQAWANPATWLNNRRWTDEPLAPEDQPGRRSTIKQRIRDAFLRSEGFETAPLDDDDGMRIDLTATRS